METRMVNNAELKAQVRDIMATTFGVDESDLPEDVQQASDSRWTSLYHMTLLVALEDHFDVSFSMEEMPELTSIPRIFQALERHGAKAGM
jgi:acyl carrier protein